jgi:phosphoribosylformylglycinamidine synthase
MNFKATVNVVLRPAILDVQGKTVEHALHSIGLSSVTGVRIGKHIEFTVTAETAAAAKEVAESAAQQLLANAVMEDFTVTIEQQG